MKSLFPNKKVYTINNVPSKNRIKIQKILFIKKKLYYVWKYYSKKNQINLLKIISLTINLLKISNFLLEGERESI